VIDILRHQRKFLNEQTPDDRLATQDRGLVQHSGVVRLGHCCLRTDVLLSALNKLN